MADEYPSTATMQGASAAHVQMVDRERAQAFSQALRILLQRQNFYVPLTGTYLLPQLYERVRAVDGRGIHVNTLRAYLRGESLPSDSKVRLLADALGMPRGVLLYAAGYLTAEDLPNYPGPQATLAAIEADMREVEALPLAPATKERVLHDLRTSARILQLVAAERAPIGYTTAADERELLIEQLIELWSQVAPPPPPFTSTEEASIRARTMPPAAREAPLANQHQPARAAEDAPPYAGERVTAAPGAGASHHSN